MTQQVKDDTQKTAYIMVGPSGVGKSAYIKNNFEEDEQTVIISRDRIREMLYGSMEEYYELYNQGESKQLEQRVSQIYEKKLKRTIQKEVPTIIIDNTSLSRRRRIHEYNQFKQKQYEVVIVWCHQPLAEILRRNELRTGSKRVNPDIIKRMYKTIQIPRLGVDMDTLIFNGADYPEYQEEINERIHEGHESPYHFETIHEHIELAIQNAPDDLTREVARYHDLGKSVCKFEDDESRPDKNYWREMGNRYCMYVGHEFVSACYYLAKMYSRSTQPEPYEWMVAEAVYQHMAAHQGLSKKVIRRNNLDDDTLALIESFAKVDDVSKVSDEGLTAKLKEMRTA